MKFLITFENNDEFSANFQNSESVAGAKYKFLATFESNDEFNANLQNSDDARADFGETTMVAEAQYRFGFGLKYDPNTRVVSVDAAEEVTEGDPRPVTSAAVQVQVGNIEVLLHTI